MGRDRDGQRELDLQRRANSLLRLNSSAVSSVKAGGRMWQDGLGKTSTRWQRVWTAHGYGEDGRV